MTDPNAYRDELAVAHARIADLEERLLEAEGKSQRLPISAIELLAEQRAAIVAEVVPFGGFGVSGVLLALVLAAFMLVLYVAGPFDVRSEVLFFAVALNILRRTPARNTKRKRMRLAEIDQKIAALETRTRIAIDERAETLPIREDDEEPELEALEAPEAKEKRLGTG